MKIIKLYSLCMVATVILIITGKIKLTEDGENIEDVKVVLGFIALSPIIMIKLIIDRLREE